LHPLLTEKQKPYQPRVTETSGEPCPTRNEKKPNVQEPPKDDDEGDLPPNRDIKEPEKDPKISVQTNGKFADDFQDLNSV
jgi:hypothetical protein